MARPLRLEYEGALYHVMARGNDRGVIFRRDVDRVRFLEKLEETVEEYHLRVYAYVLMTNHYHLLLCTPRGNLSAAMQQFQTSYTAYYKGANNRSGHLYGGRYKSPVVEGDSYLLNLTRYIHLNPVRIRSMCRQPVVARARAVTAYPWSSYRAYIGLDERAEWMDYGPLTELVARGRKRQAKAYRAYVESGLEEADEELQEAMSCSSKAVGDVEFCEWAEELHRELAATQGSPADVSMRHREATVPVEEILAQICIAFDVEEEWLKRRGNDIVRDMLIKALLTYGGKSRREIGRLLGHADGATVGRRLKAIREDTQMNEGVQKAWRHFKKERQNANCKA